jgi:flavin-dependent dehydrogenase
MSASLAGANRYDVIIVGAGPAGCSTALNLVNLDPRWASRVLVLDRASFPRHKLCSGGLTGYGAKELVGLRLELGVPSIAVASAHLRFESVSLVRCGRAGRPAFRVVRRDEFDHWLVQEARARGVPIRDGVSVISVEREPDGVALRTNTRTLRCTVVVGAAGATGVVRRQLGFRDRSRVGRALEVLTACDPATTPEFAQGYAVFDFTPMLAGVRGYYWDFPSYVKGRAMMNRGIGDVRLDGDAPAPDLRANLAACLELRGENLADHVVEGAPARWFDPDGLYAMPHAVLAGDEAGLDPLFGEGIGFALAQGRVAAKAIDLAFKTGDFSFAGYRERLLADRTTSVLARRARAARLFYSVRNPRLLRLVWRLGGPLLCLGIGGHARLSRQVLRLEGTR